MKYRHLFIFLFLYLWIFLGFYLSLAESPTFDEPVHLKAALQYQEGNYNFDPIEPPLLRRTVYFFGQKIEKLTGPSPTLFPYRAVVVIISGVLLSLLLWPIFSRSLFSGLLASVLLVYEPNLLAHSHYFTTDAVSAILSVIAALLILPEKWIKRSDLLILALAVSLAVSLKVASLALILPLLLMKIPRLGKGRVLFLLGFVVLFVWATYDFGFHPIFRRFPVNMPLGGYLRAIKENILFSWRGQPIFFSGELYLRSPWFKTFAVVFLKNTLPLLILALWAAKDWKGKKHLLVIIFLTFVVGLVKPLNFGMRHLLPLQVALVLLAAKVIPKSTLAWVVFSLLITWQILAFRNALPQLITYTNELAGKPNTIFTDSDYDWGQGLVMLRKEIASRGLSDYQLAYFGNTDPALFLGSYTRIKDENPVATQPIRNYDVTKPAIISLTCYYLCGYSESPLFKYRPKEVIAQSFYYFR